MPNIFTVYNCGTGFNRDNVEEVIGNLATRTEGTENIDWMINDGPGSAPKSKTSKAITPGTKDPWTGQKVKAPLFAQLKGVTDGYGWEHNVQYAVSRIRALVDGSRVPPTTINMAGWSRGAITCHMIAHALIKEPNLQGLKLNIFAFDPVPGPGNFKLEQISLPSNVHHYACVIMEDESRKVMKPLQFDKSSDDEDGKNFKVYTLPGDHGTAVQAGRINEVSTIGRALAHKFLTKHGTRLNRPFILNDLQFCELYAKIRIDIDRYRKLKGNKIMLKLLGALKRNVKNEFRDTAYFINPHHARRFEKTFPGMWQLMNTGSHSKTALDREVAQIRNLAPTTYLSLEKVGII